MAKLTGRFWFDWHSLSGVWCGLLLFIICWSGSFATLSREIDWLLNEQLHASESHHESRLLADYVQVALTSNPGWQLQSVSQPLYPWFNAEVIMTTPAEQLRRVYVDPAALSVTGSTSYFNVQRFFRSLHMGLFHWHGLGAYLVLLLTLPFGFLALSALWVYRGWWKKWFSLNWGTKPRQQVASLHKLTGVWSLWFCLLIFLTCVWYLVETLRYDAGDGVISRLGTHESSEQQITGNYDLYLQNMRPIELSVQSLYPELQVRNSHSEAGLLYFDGQTDSWWLRDRASKLYFDSRSGALIASQFPDDLSFYWYLSDLADPLHFGNFAGLPVKILWALFGLALSFLSLSGSYMYVKRRREGKKVDSRYNTTLIITATIIICALTIYFGISESVTYLDSGQHWSFDIRPWVLVFVVAWSLLTSAILGYWCYRLRQLSTFIRQDEMSVARV